jgi:hypothetical protein
MEITIRVMQLIALCVSCLSLGVSVAVYIFTKR